MSRTCMYCGRELPKGERCNCPHSVKMRAEKEGKSSTSADNASSQEKTHTQNTTYTPPKKTWKQRWEEKKRTRPVRNKAYRPSNGGVRAFFAYVTECLRRPVYKAANPGYVSMWWTMLLVGLQGFVVSTAVFLTNSAVKKGLFGILSMAFGFRGIEGWKNILQMLATALSGTAMGYLQFFIMCTIFFLIGKLVLRSTASYKEYVERFAPCTIPLTAIGLMGVIFAVFSPAVISIMLICGVVIEVILIYESLRAYWHTKPDFLVYTIVGGLFIYAVFCYNLYKILVL